MGQPDPKTLALYEALERVPLVESRRSAADEPKPETVQHPVDLQPRIRTARLASKRSAKQCTVFMAWWASAFVHLTVVACAVFFAGTVTAPQDLVRVQPQEPTFMVPCADSAERLIAADMTEALEAPVAQLSPSELPLELVGE